MDAPMDAPWIRPDITYNKETHMFEFRVPLGDDAGTAILVATLPATPPPQDESE